MQSVFWTVAVGVGGFLVGFVGCAVVAVVDWVAWVMVLPSRRAGTLAAEVGLPRSTEPDDPGGKPGEPIEASAADGVRLAGVWYPGQGEVPGGRVVLVIRGFAEYPPARLARTEALREAGWHVAALDTRAHGRSGGDRGSFGAREAGDVSAWLDALAAQGRLGPGPLAVWGRSMGAAIAIRAAANDRRVAALVLEAPFMDLERTLVLILRRRRLPLASVMAKLILRKAHSLAGVSLARPRPIDVAPGVKVPALVIHGSDDSLIPADQARSLARAFAIPAEYLEVEGAGHTSVVEVGGEALLGRVTAFLGSVCVASA